MTPISPRKTSKRGVQGFTLVEMLVVLTIIGLLAAVAAVRLPGASRIGANHRTVSLLHQAAERARQQAMLSGDAVEFTPDQHISSTGTITALAPGGGALTFFADGSSTGGIVGLGGRKLFDIDWLTGEIRDAS